MDDWWNIATNILVAIGTIFLGVMALKAILQTRNIRKKERRNILLKEIIDWATNVFNVNKDGVFNDMAHWQRDIKEAKDLAAVTIEEWKSISKETVGKNQYMSNISLNFDSVLQNAVQKLIDDLQAYLDVMTPISAVTITRFDRVERKIKVYKSANEVIRRASQIITKETS